MDGTRIHVVRSHSFPSQDYPTFEAILGKFLADSQANAIEHACFGVAGPVIEGCSHITNLPWALDERVLAGIVGAPAVKLLNDLEASALGMLALDDHEMAQLNQGASPARKGNIAVIAAGTGLGEGILYWDGEAYRPIASEGGHCDFAPRNALEIELLQYLQENFGDHISYERVLSGPGLHNVYRFCRDTSGEPEPSWLREAMTTSDASAVVSQAALNRQDPVCEKALSLFVSIYGAEAGNLALKCQAIGGVLVGGGIAPKILPALTTGAFMDSFLAKGRFSRMLKTFPVHVALNPNTALLGATHYAAREVSRARNSAM